MEVRTRKEIIEQTITTYVAYDGTEFECEFDCLAHEQREKRMENIVSANKLRLRNLDGVIPINSDATVGGDNIFTWYKLNSAKDFDTLMSAFRYEPEIMKPTFYPTLVCMEHIGLCEYEEQAYGYSLQEMVDITTNFWKKLGCNAIIEADKSNVLMGGNEE